MSETQRKRYVVGFLIDKQARKVLLVTKNRPEAWAGRMTGPGGKIEEGETPVAAMVREFREECGLITKESDWIHTVFLDTGAFTLDFFVVYGNPHRARQMESENISVSKLDELPAQLFSNARWALTVSLDEQMPFPIQLKYKGVGEPAMVPLHEESTVVVDQTPVTVVPEAATRAVTSAPQGTATVAAAKGEKEKRK